MDENSKLLSQILNALEGISYSIDNIQYNNANNAKSQASGLSSDLSELRQINKLLNIRKKHERAVTNEVIKQQKAFSTIKDDAEYINNLNFSNNEELKKQNKLKSESVNLISKEKELLEDVEDSYGKISNKQKDIKDSSKENSGWWKDLGSELKNGTLKLFDKALKLI